jgi:hypothetical protein
MAVFRDHSAGTTPGSQGLPDIPGREAEEMSSLCEDLRSPRRDHDLMVLARISFASGADPVGVNAPFPRPEVRKVVPR